MQVEDPWAAVLHLAKE